MAENRIKLILGENETIEGHFGDNMNTLIVAPPGGGKTYSVVSPNIVHNEGCSMFIDDKKGNLYHKHKEELQRAGYKVYCFNLISFDGDLHYNPFSSLKTRDDIHKMVRFLIPGEKIGKEPYWEDSARELAEALIDILMVTTGGASFKKLIKLLHKTGTQYTGSDTPVEDYVDELIRNLNLIGKECIGMERYQSLRRNAPDTWRCVRNTCITCLGDFDSDDLFSVTETTSIDFSTMGKEKVALFVTSSDVNGAYAPVVQLMYRDIVRRLVECADRDYVLQNSMLPLHVRFILDDFASGTVMNDFEKVVANCRSRNISFMLCIQSVTQLKGLYQEMTDSILDCINYKVYFSSSNLATQQYLSLIMDRPLSEIQQLGKEDICIEQIHCVPRFGKRYQADRLFVNWHNGDRKAQPIRRHRKDG
ncbi:MAG: type IV secretory system conjugative DNA transfer family protein [Bacillota bacterium]|nr:type IV secretory system conjugative DNA transfer family protein [Bacillota bacterium]